ncbi:MAG: DNA adenine methylase [Pleurocapsa sp. SU_5_0]|nr:DNA adenine methylase [Pleurocapsa sp. SU_5_0]NJR47978.1 DNA adenine methylase [Hyellaceae cyanobacterium CSU_1_1]
MSENISPQQETTFSKARFVYTTRVQRESSYTKAAAEQSAKKSFNQLEAKPFLKWAGGKRQLLSVIQQYLPAKYTEYYEPFIGAGAMLFSLQPKSSTINDTNSELVNCYQVIRDQPEELLKLCQQHRENNTKEYYYQLRQQDRQDDFNQRTPVEKAARIIYLNKTCFNGLFRVNSSGQFNVPYGKYKNPVIVDPAVIQAISTYLNRATCRILKGDFEQAVATAKKGAFIYFDPPYHPVSDTSSFTGYSMNGFGEQEQIRLKKLCDRLTDRGCQVLASNSAAPFIKSLYDDPNYKVVEVKATRAINAVASKRGKINELLIHNKYVLRK